MGQRGPIPKRSSERRRRNKESVPSKGKAGRPRTQPKAKVTLTELRKRAGDLGIPGRSRMNAAQLEKAIAERNQAAAQLGHRPASDDWHAIARDWYGSLAESGQADFYEASDWAAAYYVAEVMSRHLRARKLSAQLFQSVWSAMSELLTTEGARRRARIELEREQEGDQEDGKVAVMDEYRERLGTANR